MQVMELNDILKKAGRKDQVANLVRSLRKDELIWSFFTQATDSQSQQINSLLNEQKLNPGTLGLIAFNSELALAGYPDCPIQAALLENCMVNYETFIQQHNPAESLEEAAKLAIVLIEKRKLSTSWNKTILEVVNRMHINDGHVLQIVWGTTFAILINLIKDQDDLLLELSRLQNSDQGIELLVNNLLSLPVSDEKKANFLFDIVEEHDIETADKILNQLIAINERPLAEILAALCVDKYININGSEEENNDHSDTPDAAIEKSMKCRQIGNLAQIAGESDLARQMIEKSIKILETVTKGLKIQKLSLLEQEGKQLEINDAAHSNQLDQVSDPLLVKEMASIGYPSNQENAGDLNEHPIVMLQHANQMKKAGNDELARLECEKSLGGVNGNQIARLVNFRPQFNPGWKPTDVITALLSMDAVDEAVKIGQKLLEKNPSSLSVNKFAADALMKAKKYSEAMPLLELLSLSHADSLEVERTFAECHKQMGNRQAELEIRKKLIEVENPLMDDLLNFADSAADCGLTEEAFNATSKVIEQEPENVRALTINGKLYGESGNMKLAQENYQKAIDMGNDDPDPWIGLVNLYLGDNEPRKAIETLRRGLAALPENKEIKKRLAELLMDTGSVAEALPLLNELSASVKDINISILQAEAMKALGLPEYKELIDSLYTQFPENPEITQAYAAELIKTGKRNEARLVMEEHVSHTLPTDPSALIYADAVVGMDYQHSGEPKKISAKESEKVKNIIDASLTHDPENNRAQLLKAEWLNNGGLYDQAFAVYSRLLEKQNSLDKTLIERLQAGFATAAAFIGKFELALASIKQAVDSKPDWIGLRQTFAQVYSLAGEINDALDQANTVLELGPQVIEGIVWFVEFLSKLGKTEEAELKLRNWLEENPNNLLLQAKLAEILLQSGKVTEAKEMADKILPNLSADSTDEELVIAARILMNAGDSVSAIKCLEYRRNNNSTISAQLDLAGFLYQLGQFNTALAELDQISGTNDAACLINCLKADTLMKAGELQSALDLLQSGSTDLTMSEVDQPLYFVPERWLNLLSSNNPVLQLEAGFAFLSGKPEQSREYSKKWIESDPDNAEAWLLTLESEQALGGNSAEIHKFHFDIKQEFNPFIATLAALKIDALLESEQVLEAQKLYEGCSDDSSFILQAVGIRLSILMGRLAEAESILDEILESRQNIQELTSVIKISTTRLLVKSCMALKRWNEALTFSSENARNYVWHTTCGLQYLMVLTKAVEFEKTAKILSIEAHSPTLFLQEVSIDEELVWLDDLLNGKLDEELKRWILRAKMAVSPAAESIRAFARITPTPDDAAAMVAALHYNDQDTTAIQVVKNFTSNSHVLMELAIIQSANDTDTAIETLNSLLDNDPLSPAALALRSTLFEKVGKVDQAINDLEQAIGDWPNETNWRLTAADLWQRYGNTANAIQQLQKAHELKTNDPTISLALSKSYADEAEYDQAVEILQSVTQNNPNNIDAWEELSEAYSGCGRLEEALDAAKKASELNPLSIKPYLMSGKILLTDGNLDSALEQAKLAIAQNKKDADAVLFMARVLFLKGEKRQALAALEMTNQCENVTVQTMIDHVNLVKEINGGPSAKELIASLSAKYPENVDLMKMLASVQVENGDTGEAEQTVKRALQVDPDEPDLHLFLGKINAESGQLDQAIHHLSQGITSKTDKMDGYLMLSKVYEQQREFSKALEALKQAMEIAPNDTRGYVAAANLYRNSKDYASAEKVLQKAVEIDPKDVSIRRQLGALLALKLVHHSQEASSQS